MNKSIFIDLPLSLFLSGPVLSSLGPVEPCEPRTQEGEDQGLSPPRLWQEVLSVQPPPPTHDHPLWWVYTHTRTHTHTRARTHTHTHTHAQRYILNKVSCKYEHQRCLYLQPPPPPQPSIQESETLFVRHAESRLNARTTWKYTGGPTQERPPYSQYDPPGLKLSQIPNCMTNMYSLWYGSKS